MTRILSDQQWDKEPEEYTSHKGKFPFKLREEVVHAVRVDTEAEEQVREEEHHEEGTNPLHPQKVTNFDFQCALQVRLNFQAKINKEL